jgi:hypothetical protein
MSLFKPAENTMAYFKAGLMGEAGSGKTHTATLVAIGLVQHLKKLGISGHDRPAMLLDTENGSSWIKPMFDEVGIPLLVAKTRAFRDLVPALREAEKGASVLIVDSVTHFWEELQASYLARLSERKGRAITRLEFQDWNYIKGTWRKFSDAFVTSNLHCILCGRLGWEYETVEEDGKKQIEKSGAKMQAEKGLGYEPNILVWMERNMDLHTKVVARTATVLKDRSRRLDGKQFPDPTFATFLPHIDFMALGGKHEAADTTRNSEDIMPDDDAPMSDIKSIRRTIVVEEVQALMVKHYPSRSAEDVKAKNGLLLEFFKTASWTEVEKLMPLTHLQSNYDALHRKLEGKPSRYDVAAPSTEPVDEIPFTEPAKEATPQINARPPAPDEPLDKEAAAAALAGFSAAMTSAHTQNKITRVWNKWATVIEQCDKLAQSEFLLVKAGAMKRVKDDGEARLQEDAKRATAAGYNVGPALAEAAAE